MAGWVPNARAVARALKFVCGLALVVAIGMQATRVSTHGFAVRNKVAPSGRQHSRTTAEDIVASSQNLGRGAQAATPADHQDYYKQRRAAQLQLIAESRRKDGTPALMVTGRSKGLANVAFSGDGSFYTSDTDEGDLGVWDTKTGRLLQRLPLTNTGQVAISRDGQMIAAVEFPLQGDSHPYLGGAIILWRTSDASIINVLDVGASAESLEFSPDGTMLALADREAGVRLFETASGSEKSRIGPSQLQKAVRSTGKRLWKLEPDEKESMTLTATFGPSKDTLLVYGVARGAGFCSMWDLVKGRPRWTIGRLVTLAQWSPDGQTLVVSNAEGFSAINASSGKTHWRVSPLDQTRERVYLRFTTDGASVVAWNWNTERAWRSKTGDAILMPDGPLAETGAMFEVNDFDPQLNHARLIVPDGKSWLTHESGYFLDRQGNTRLIARGSGQPLWQGRSLAYSPWHVSMNRNHVISTVTDDNSRFIRWEWEPTKGPKTTVEIDAYLRASWEEDCGKGGGGSTIARETMVVSSGSCAKAYSLVDGARVGSFRLDGAIDALAISADESLIAAAIKKRGDVWIRRVRNGDDIIHIVAHADGQVTDLAFSRDGRYLASANYSEVKVWSAETGRHLRTFGELSSPITFAGMSLIAGPGIQSVDLSELQEVLRNEDVGKTSLRVAGATRSAAQAGDPIFNPREDCGLFGPTVSSNIRGNLLAVSCSVKDAPIRIMEFPSRRLVATLINRSVQGALGWGLPVFSDDDQFVLAGNGTGISIWRNPLGGAPRWNLRPVVSVATFTDGNWLVVDHEGRFDSNRLDQTQGAHWVMPDRALHPAPFELFLRDYYEPRLLSRVLAGERLPPVRPLASLNRLQPVVVIEDVVWTDESAGKAEVKVQVARATEVSSREGKPTQLSTEPYDLRLFRDGQEVAWEPRGGVAWQQERRDEGSTQADIPRWRDLTRIPLNPDGTRHITFPVQIPRRADVKEVTFSAYAFNEDRVKSATAAKTVAVPRALGSKLGRAYVITVGVNRTESSPAWDLQYAVNDARILSEIVSTRSRATEAFEEVVPIRLISDHEATGNDEAPATKSNLQVVLDHLAGRPVDATRLDRIPGADRLQKVTPDDFVLIAVSSHGYTDRRGVFHFVLADIGTDLSGLVTPWLEERTLSSDELSLWLRPVDAGELVLIVDACHAEATVSADGFKPGPMGSRGLGQLAYDKGMRVLAASRAQESAIERGGKIKHGLLTYALVREGLEQWMADFQPQNGQIKLAEWLEYAVDAVPRLFAEGDAKGFVTVKGGEGGSDRYLGPKRTKSQYQQPVLFDFSKTEGVLVASRSSRERPH